MFKFNWKKTSYIIILIRRVKKKDGFEKFHLKKKEEKRS